MGTFFNLFPCEGDAASCDARARDGGLRPAGRRSRHGRAWLALMLLCAGLVTAGAGREAAAATLTFGALEGAQLRDAGGLLRHADMADALGVSALIDAGELGAASIAAGGLSGIDLFLTGKSALSAPLGEAIIGALVAHVEKGGALIIHGDRGAREEAMGPLLAAFGASLATPAAARVPLSITAPDHAVINGPFGRVAWLSIGDAARFAFSDPAWRTLAAYPGGEAAIGVLAPDRAAGRLGLVVLLPDVECFMQFARGCGGLGGGDYRIALANALTYGAAGRLTALEEADFGPSPVPLPGAAFLLAPLLGLAGVLRMRCSCP